MDISENPKRLKKFFCAFTGIELVTSATERSVWVKSSIRTRRGSNPWPFACKANVITTTLTRYFVYMFPYKHSRHLDSNQGPPEIYKHYNRTLYQLSYSEAKQTSFGIYAKFTYRLSANRKFLIKSQSLIKWLLDPVLDHTPCRAWTCDIRCIRTAL